MNAFPDPRSAMPVDRPEPATRTGEYQAATYNRLPVEDVKALPVVGVHPPVAKLTPMPFTPTFSTPEVIDPDFDIE